MAESKAFATTLPKALKAHAARTGVAATPVAIRSRMHLSDALRDDVRFRLARKVGKYATHLERLSVRFEDVHGPKGGFDVRCRIKAVLSARPSVVVEERAGDAALGLRRAAAVLERTLRRTLGKVGFAAHHERKPKEAGRKAEAKRIATSGPPRRDDAGSLIGGRVGHSRADLEDALDRPEKRRRDFVVDTSKPGVSASDRRAGYGATAARNTKRNTAGMQSALEDSRTKPSRKSTRRSTNRMKSATLIERTAQLAAHDPSARARRGGTEGKRPRRGG